MRGWGQAHAVGARRATTRFFTNLHTADGGHVLMRPDCLYRLNEARFDAERPRVGPAPRSRLMACCSRSSLLLQNSAYLAEGYQFSQRIARAVLRPHILSPSAGIGSGFPYRFQQRSFLVVVSACDWRGGCVVLDRLLFSAAACAVIPSVPCYVMG